MFYCVYEKYLKREAILIFRYLVNHLIYNVVELGRFELPSKRGNHKLSTCLSSPSIFELKQDRSHQLEPYPLKFRKGNEAYLNYSRFNCATEPKCFGKTAFE